MHLLRLSGHLVPLMYALLLFEKRETLRNQEALDREEANGLPSIGHLAFLVQSYLPEYYYFEVLECGRRLALASAIGVIPSSTVASPTAGLLVSTLRPPFSRTKKEHHASAYFLLFWLFSSVSSSTINSSIADRTRKTRTQIWQSL